MRQIERESVCESVCVCVCPYMCREFKMIKEDEERRREREVRKTISNEEVNGEEKKNQDGVSKKR